MIHVLFIWEKNSFIVFSCNNISWSSQWTQNPELRKVRHWSHNTKNTTSRPVLWRKPPRDDLWPWLGIFSVRLCAERYECTAFIISFCMCARACMCARVRLCVCSECAGVTVTLHGITQYCVFRSHISHHQRCLHPNSTAVITGGRGLGPVVSPPSWNNRKHCIIFPPLHWFSTLIEKYIASCLALFLHTTPCWYSIQNVFVGVCYAALFLWEQRLCFCNDTIRGILPLRVFSLWLIYE